MVAVNRRSISIHAPLAGCDIIVVLLLLRTQRFQSTHPLRGATNATGARMPDNTFQSTHPLRGATETAFSKVLGFVDFNPRTPCGVRLRGAGCPESVHQIFQSTHPLRGATWWDEKADRQRVISIHAPLAGCDQAVCRDAQCGQEFQSTHPLRGATS